MNMFTLLETIVRMSKFNNRQKWRKYCCSHLSCLRRGTGKEGRGREQKANNKGYVERSKMYPRNFLHDVVFYYESRLIFTDDDKHLKDGTIVVLVRVRDILLFLSRTACWIRELACLWRALPAKDGIPERKLWTHRLRQRGWSSHRGKSRISIKPHQDRKNP